MYDGKQLEKVSDNEFKVIGSNEPWIKNINSISFELSNIVIENQFYFDEYKDDELENYEFVPHIVSINAIATISYETLYARKTEDDDKEVITLKEILAPRQSIPLYIGVMSNGYDKNYFPANFSIYHDYTEDKDVQFVHIGLDENKMNSIIELLLKDKSSTIKVEIEFDDSYYATYADSIYDIYLDKLQGKVKSVTVVSKRNSEIELNNLTDKIEDIAEKVTKNFEETKKEIEQNVYHNDNRHHAEMKQMWVNQGILVISTVLIISTVIICGIFC